MNRMSPRMAAAVMIAALATTACSSAVRATRTEPQPAPVDAGGAEPGLPVPRTAAIGQLPYSPADVHFMTGMIPHHAQAIVMGGWAATRARSQGVKVLAERIVVAQRDEIALIRGWLREVGQPVPAANATHMRMTMDGVEHDMLMPGMLSPEEMKRLESARGTEFDRLFLTYMIRHHEGAIAMVEKLFASHGAAQDELIYKLASDVYADQTTEIDRMQRMLEGLPPNDDSR